MDLSDIMDVSPSTSLDSREDWNSEPTISNQADP
jgi:hypothetical protein